MAYDRVQTGTTDEDESFAMSPLKVKRDESDMIDQLLDHEEEEIAALLPRMDAASGTRTKIDKWALACLLLQHTSK